MSGVPSPRASSCPPQPAPCLPAHKLYMPLYWGVSGIQSMNSQIADFCSFSLFTCFCPRAKQLQPPMGWCSGSGGSLAAHSPREQNSSCLPMTLCQTYSQPAWSSGPASLSGGSLLPCFHSCPTEVCWQEGWNLAGVSSGGCNSRLGAQTALQGPLSLTNVSTEASRAFGPLLGDSSCGGLRNRRLWKPPIPCTPLSFAANFGASGTQVPLAGPAVLSWGPRASSSSTRGFWEVKQSWGWSWARTSLQPLACSAG